MKKLLIAAALMLPMTSYGFQAKDPLHDEHYQFLVEMNDTINNTNFIVDGRCSGTLIDLSQKLVLTNYHCVTHKVSQVRVKKVVDGEVTTVSRERLLDVPIEQKAYQGYNEVGSSTYVTEIVAKDQNRDLALLRIKSDTIPHNIASPVLPAEMQVIRGETAWAVGNPRMLDASVTKGIVSSVTRQFRVPWANGEKVSFLQFDGGIVGGNSGGALYNAQGFLIGVPAAGAESTVGLAIPADTVRDFLGDNCWALWKGAEQHEDCVAPGEKEVDDKGDD